MPAAVAVFPAEPFSTRVDAIRDDLAARFDVTPERTPPHVSLCGADAYEDGLLGAVEEVVGRSERFECTVSGVGVFPATDVVYLPVARSESLTALHTGVTAVARSFATGENAHYRADRWIPHVTLAREVGDALPDVVDRLSEDAHSYTFTAEAVGVISNPREGEAVVETIPLS